MSSRPIPPPPDLDDAARSLFRGLQRQMKSDGHWRPTDAHLLAGYVRAVVAGQSADALALAEALAITPARRNTAQPTKETPKMFPTDPQTDAAHLVQALNAARHDREPIPMPTPPAVAGSDDALARLADAVVDRIEQRSARNGQATDEGER